MNILHHPDHSSIPQMQTKALKDFYALKEEEQQKIVEAFEQEKIKSDILKTIYQKEGIEGTLIGAMFLNHLNKKETN